MFEKGDIEVTIPGKQGFNLTGYEGRVEHLEQVWR